MKMLQVCAFKLCRAEGHKHLLIEAASAIETQFLRHFSDQVDSESGNASFGEGRTVRLFERCSEFVRKSNKPLKFNYHEIVYDRETRGIRPRSGHGARYLPGRAEPVSPFSVLSDTCSAAPCTAGDAIITGTTLASCGSFSSFGESWVL